MRPTFPFKQEFPGESSCSSSSSSSRHHWSAAEDEAAPPPPRPMEGLHEAGPAPFLVKAFEMVDDLATDHIISWSRGGQSFVVWDPNAFSTILLPTYFKHNNFSSFIRQLNTYGFRKIDAEKWEFANKAFIRGQKHLLKSIRRRRAPSQSPPQHDPVMGPCVELGRFGPEEEVDRLRRDKKVLTMELVKLRQEQQSTRLHLKNIETRLRGTEKKQQQMMSFLAGAMQNPDFVHRLLQKREDGVSERRDIRILDRETGRVKFEAFEEHGTQTREEVSELEVLALEMQGLGKAKRGREIEQLGDGERELDGGFWDELLNQGFDEGEKNEDEDEDEDVNVLADRFGFLGSSSK